MEGHYYRVGLLLLIVLCSFGILFENFALISGFATSVDTPSNVSIERSFAIEFSSGLSEGINFGNILFLPADDVNATHNYDGASSGSTFFVNVSLDGNTAIDFCIRATGDLETLGGDSIGVENETYTYYNATTNSTHPVSSPKISLNTTYMPSGTEIPLGGVNYWRFWLDVPAGQATGNYNNTVEFKAVQTGNGC
jgi:hypothetical protein